MLESQEPTLDSVELVGHNFNFQQAKIIFKPNRISELDILENIAIYLNREVIVNEKNDSIMLSTAWKNLYSTIALIISLV